MAVTLTYTFDIIFVRSLVESVIFVVMYGMLFLSSRHQPRATKSDQVLKVSSIVGMALSGVRSFLPLMVCTTLEVACIVYSVFYVLIFYSHTLVGLGIPIFIIGERNYNTYGKTLSVSGVFWIVGSFGYIIIFIFVRFSLGVFLPFGISWYLFIPAVILMIIHGAKFKDTFFSVAGVLFIISWLVYLIVPLFSVLF